MIDLFVLKEAVYSTGISEDWSKERCEIEYVKAMARESGIELTVIELITRKPELLKDDAVRDEISNIIENCYY